MKRGEEKSLRMKGKEEEKGGSGRKNSERIFIREGKEEGKLGKQ